MFSRFFRSKFYKKSKSCLNTIKVKVEIIQRKRNAVQKFLKSDIAEFLRRGLDYNAYQRAAGLLMEYNKSSSYELIDKYCGYVLNHLDDLNKQRDCPDECKEAVQTLIYAAARFGDLPELRELRGLLTQKHGNSFQPYLSQEFVSKLGQDLPGRETTIQLLHDIAGEFSLQWDSNALIQQIYRSPSSCEERSKDEQRSNEGEGSREDVISIYDSGGYDEDESMSMRSSMWSQDSKKASSSSSSSSSSLPSISEDDDEAQNNKKPFSSGLVPPPYSLIPKPNNDQVDEEKEKPKPTPQPKGISVRTIRSGAPARHVHPKLPEFDDLTTQLASTRRS